MPPSFHNRFTRFLCSLVCSAVLFSSSVPASADVTNDLQRIITLLETIDVSTFDSWDLLDAYLANIDSNLHSVALLRTLLLYALYQTSTGQANPSDAYLYRIDQRQADILLSMLSLTNDVFVIRSTTSDINTEVGSIDSLLYQLFNEYTGGDHSYAWNVHVLNDGTADLIASFSNRIDWLAYELGQTVGNELHVDLSEITDRQDGTYLFLACQESDANDAGQSMAETVDDEIAAQNTADAETEDDVVDSLYDTEEPEMDTYQTASDTDTSDADKDDLLDSLSDDEHLTHSPLLTLIDAEHFYRATGVQGDMVYNLSEGNFGSFVGDMTNICTTGWYGLLAVASALLFWRKQNEISGIVRGTNFSRV